MTNNPKKTGLIPVLTIMLPLLLFTAARAEKGLCADMPFNNTSCNPIYSIPEQLGEVIYQHNRENPDQLYIVGMGHRDALTGLNGADTVQAQIEVFRIGEWLIRNKGLELLLPEGYFANKDKDRQVPSERRKRTAAAVETAALKKQLEDDSVYVNSEMLLLRNFNIYAEQVEDPELYMAVNEKLRLLQKNRQDALTYLFERSQLDYLQERRTASMLQKIPGIINNASGNGGTGKKQALFTIGLSHLPYIVRYLKEREIVIQSPLFTSFQDYEAGINLLQEDFGITVIVPPSLSDGKSSFLASSAR